MPTFSIDTYEFELFIDPLFRLDRDSHKHEVFFNSNYHFLSRTGCGCLKNLPDQVNFFIKPKKRNVDPKVKENVFSSPLNNPTQLFAIFLLQIGITPLQSHRNCLVESRNQFLGRDVFQQFRPHIVAIISN